MKLAFLVCLTTVLVVMGTDGFWRKRWGRRTSKPFIKPVLSTVAKTYFRPDHTGIKIGCGLYRKFTEREIRALDANTDGLVDWSEAASYFGVDQSDAQLDHFMNMADAKRDGNVDVDEFFDAALTFEDEGPESAP
ncbi:uncharacterized protein [Haliotis asinina]|uniref:uncharacterized protein n=1 Tax=Haliotis asinina TaxID=109174 RepID=UPI0035321160